MLYAAIPKRTVLFAWAVCVIISLASAISMPIAALVSNANEPPKNFAFDNGFQGDAGLNFLFFRPMETLDRNGIPVPADLPRFGTVRLISAAPSVEQLLPNTISYRMYGSGFDHDGVTPLLVMRGGANLDVYTVTNDAMLDAIKNGTGRNRTRLNQGQSSKYDIMQGAVQGKAYTPRAGVICHGLIVIFCDVFREIKIDDWQSVSVAFLVSVDQGESWSILYEDIEVQTGIRKGREWSMQNWWPTVRGIPPLEAWFAAADYRKKPNTDGGRVFAFKTSRTDVGSPWEFDPVEVPIVSSNGVGEHAHTAGVVTFGEDGIRVIAAFGDTITYNRVASAIRIPDGEWKGQDNYHGGLNNQIGYQFVGCAPGPNQGDILVGSDEDGDQIDLLHPDDDSKSRAAFQRIYGQPYASGLGNRVFVIRTPTPEYGGPYVANYESGYGNYGGAAARILYSHNGMNWGEILANGATGQSHTIHGNHIYTDSLINETGFRRIRIPQTLLHKPLLVGAGTQNRLVANIPFNDGNSGNGLRLLSREERAALEPQPPCLGQVFELESRKTQSNVLANWIPAGTKADFPAGEFLVKVWCKVIGSDGALLRLRMTSTSDERPLRTYRAIMGGDQWVPYLFYGVVNPNGNGDPYIFKLRAEVNRIDTLYKVYLVFDSVNSGDDFPGYAIPPETQAPNEHAQVTGFQCADQWTITLAGEVPDDLWDATTVIPAEFTLTTLYADAEESIDIVADQINSKLLARIYSGGELVETVEFTNTFWLRQSQFRISVAESGSGLEFTASVGSTQPVSLSTSSSLTLGPGTIHLSPLDRDSEGMDIFKGNFVWYGGQILEASFMDQSAREQLLQTLDFLDVGSGGNTTELTGFEVVTGTLLEGELSDLIQSDDMYVRTRSGYRRVFSEAHLLEMIISASTDNTSSSSIYLSIESRINEPAGIAKISLRNWSTNLFESVGQYTVGQNDDKIEISGIDSTHFVNDAGELNIRIKHVVFSQFMSFTFDSYFDMINVVVN